MDIEKNNAIIFFYEKLYGDNTVKLVFEVSTDYENYKFKYSTHYFNKGKEWVTYKSHDKAYILSKDAAADLVKSILDSMKNFNIAENSWFPSPKPSPDDDKPV